jgi:hypothetical protein
MDPAVLDDTPEVTNPHKVKRLGLVKAYNDQ